MTKSIQITVLCWDKVIDNVMEIARSIENLDCIKTVIYATDRSMPVGISVDWVRVPNEFYYAEQFREALEYATEDILLVVVGDISYRDWTEVVATCVRRFEDHERVGVWGATDPTSLWERPGVHIASLAEGLDVVAQTDCSVWAMSRDVYQRLRTADFSQNKYGWGIDWLAIVHAYSQGQLAVRDRTIVVHHPAGTGYNEKAARRQMLDFLSQMSPLESIHYNILTKYVSPIMPWGDRPGAVE